MRYLCTFPSILLQTETVIKTQSQRKILYDYFLFWTEHKSHTFLVYPLVYFLLKYFLLDVSMFLKHI